MAEQNANINGSTGGNNDSCWTPEDEMRNFLEKLVFAQSLFIWIVSVVEIPIMILTLFALCVLIKSQRSAPVFVIHLILSDLIQIICKLTMTQYSTTTQQFSLGSFILDGAYRYSSFVGLYFMACVAVERYLLVSHPIWYKSRHSLKVCCVISVIIWFVPLIFIVILYFLLYNLLALLIPAFIPYPIVILCFVGTCRGLSHSISLTPLKRKLILGTLFLVLLTYTFLILPYVILVFIFQFYHFNIFIISKLFFFFDCLLFLNPLADCILYLFIRPDVGDLMKSVHCCCRTDRHSTHSRDELSRDSHGMLACCVLGQKPASHPRPACTSVYAAEIALH